MKKAGVGFALIALLVLGACRKEIRLEAVPALPVKVSGSARVRVVLTYDRNNTLIVHLTGVPQPESLGPRYTRYVVWIQPPGGQPVNAGQIRVEGGRAHVETLTPLRRFQLFITVEEKGDVQQPGPLVVFRRDKDVEW